jgi:hypothetical protein
MVMRISFPQFLTAVVGMMMSMSLVVADQIVYLDRPSNGPTWEPFFNPKIVNASIGEKIQFIARLSPVIGNAQSGVLSFVNNTDNSISSL